MSETITKSLSAAGYIALCLAVCVMLFESITASTSKSRRGWIEHLNTEWLVFHKPLAYRGLMGLAAFCFFDGAFLGLEKLIVQQDPADGFLNLPNCLVSICLGLFLWKEAGPQDLSINLQDRTFHAKVGWPVFAHTLTGKIEQSGIVKAMGQSTVVLQPNALQTQFTIGALLFGTRSVDIADLVSEATGLPVKVIGVKRVY